MHEHVVGGFYSSPPRQAAEGDQRGRRLGPEEEDLDLIVDELMASKRDGLTGIVDAAIGRRPAQSIENLKPSPRDPACTSSSPGGISTPHIPPL